MTHRNSIRRPLVKDSRPDDRWHLFIGQGHLASFKSKLAAKLFANAIVLSAGSVPDGIKLWSDDEMAWILIGHLFPLAEK